MSTEPVRTAGPERGRRADAVRNRRRVVDAAHRLFSTYGPDVSIREVAKEAGVGLGTIYRHFPDKETLVAAVVEQRFRGLADQTRTLMATETPWNAFAAVMRRMAEMMTEDRAFSGLVGAARRAPTDTTGSDSAPAAIDHARAELDQALADVAAVAQAAGELRPDVGPAEFGLVLAGVAMSLGPPCDQPADDGSARTAAPWERYLDVAMDGLRSSSQGAAGR